MTRFSLPVRPRHVDFFRFRKWSRFGTIFDTWKQGNRFQDMISWESDQLHDHAIIWSFEKQFSLKNNSDPVIKFVYLNRYEIPWMSRQMDGYKNQFQSRIYAPELVGPRTKWLDAVHHKNLHLKPHLMLSALIGNALSSPRTDSHDDIGVRFE